MRGLCESAKRGEVCIDDLCRGSPDNTLCGFDQSEYDEMTRDYEGFVEFTEEDEEFEAGIDCHMDKGGNCGKAGSEECEFECPYNRH